MMDHGKTPVKDAWEVFQRIAVDWDSCLRKGETPDHELLERMFAGFELVFRAYCLPQNFPDGYPEGRAVEDFPIPLAHYVANQIAYIKAGYLPAPIKEIIRPGSPEIGPHEKKDIGLAVAYIKAVRAKKITDKHPVKTITKFYGVTDRAVRRWQNKYSFVDPSDYFPNTTDKERGAFIARSMKKAGVRYKQVGRGSIGRFEFPRQNKKQKPEQQ